jgi:RNA-directed DNA polymerase
MDLIEHMTSDEVLNLAYAWLCQRRKDSGPNADVWDVRWQWDELRPRVQALLRTGQYRFSPTRRAWLDGEPIEIWSAQDALVLKALAIVLGRALDGRLSQRCFHLTGRGGSKAAVRQTVAAAGENTFVFRSDVKSYYASIRHDILMQEAGRFVDDPIALDLIHQYADRMMCDGGVYTHITKGISLGCPLSPLMAAIFLSRLDEAMEATGLFYARYMDDWVVLAPSRWKLRRAVRVINQILHDLDVEQHPDKTFVGRVEREIDFLGYHFSPEELSVAATTLRQFERRVSRLYEQDSTGDRVRDYVKRFQQWVRSGLYDIDVSFAAPTDPSWMTNSTV